MIGRIISKSARNITKFATKPSSFTVAAGTTALGFALGYNVNQSNIFKNKIIITPGTVMKSSNNASNKNTEISLNSKQKSFAMEDLLNNLSPKLSPTTYKATAPLYRDAKRTYKGYYLLDIFKAMDINISQYNYVVFKAKDGFESHIKISQIINNNPFLATADNTLSAGVKWETVMDANREIDGGPYYLMWDNSITHNDWPFGIIEFKLLEIQKEFRLNMKPITNPNIAAGHKIFEENCLNCHTANYYGAKTGGGPELIMGTSITQLWPREKIKQYIKDPQSVRPLSKMPPQYERSSEDIENVVQFLEYFTKNYQVKIEESATHIQKIKEEEMLKEKEEK